MPFQHQLSADVIKVQIVSSQLLYAGQTPVVVAWCWNGDIETSIYGGPTPEAQAVVGRPRTPVSYAGVARRTTVRVATPGVGAGGIGFLMFDKINGYLYREVCTMMIMVIITVTVLDYLCAMLRKRFV